MIIKESDASALRNFKIDEVSEILKLLAEKGINIQSSIDWMYEINDAKEFGIPTEEILNQAKVCQNPDELAEWVYQNAPADKYKLKYAESLDESILVEKFSDLPQWVKKAVSKEARGYQEVNRKLAKNIDLENANWTPVDVDTLTIKELNNNDPNLIRVFKLSQYDGVYIPTYNDNYVYLPRDNKYHYASKMAKKDLLSLIVDAGIITSDKEAFQKLRKDRADAKKGSIERGKGQYQGYDYGTDENGLADYNKRVPNGKWYTTRNQDKSGYEQVNYIRQLAKKLVTMDESNYKFMMDKMNKSVEAAKELYRDILRNVNLTSKAFGEYKDDFWNPNLMRYLSDIMGNLNDIIREYDSIDRSIKKAEERGDLADTLDYLNSGYHNLTSVRQNLSELTGKMQKVIEFLDKAEENTNVEESLTEKKNKSIDSDYIYNELEKKGYHNIFANREGDGFEISKRFEKNLQKAKDVLDQFGITYNVKPFQDRFYLNMHFTPEQIAEGKERCVICGKEIEGHGNNAEPVKKGKCCNKCNNSVVIPERMKAIKKLDKYQEFQLFGSQDLDD